LIWVHVRFGPIYIKDAYDEAYEDAAANHSDGKTQNVRRYFRHGTDSRARLRVRATSTSRTPDVRTRKTRRQIREQFEFNFTDCSIFPLNVSQT
jgi:hypothetical protein